MGDVEEIVEEIVEEVVVEEAPSTEPTTVVEEEAQASPPDAAEAAPAEEIVEEVVVEEAPTPAKEEPPQQPEPAPVEEIVEEVVVEEAPEVVHVPAPPPSEASNEDPLNATPDGPTGWDTTSPERRERFVDSPPQPLGPNLVHAALTSSATHLSTIRATLDSAARALEGLAGRARGSPDSGITEALVNLQDVLITARTDAENGAAEATRALRRAGAPASPTARPRTAGAERRLAVAAIRESYSRTEGELSRLKEAARSIRRGAVVHASTPRARRSAKPVSSQHAPEQDEGRKQLQLDRMAERLTQAQTEINELRSRLNESGRKRRDEKKDFKNQLGERTTARERERRDFERKLEKELNAARDGFRREVADVKAAAHERARMLEMKHMHELDELRQEADARAEKLEVEMQDVMALIEEGGEAQRRGEWK